jgi:WD40 repeat protein
LLPAQDQPDPPLGPPAVLELIVPPGATATADGKPVDDPRAVTIADLKSDEIRRVKVAVKFADGAADERLVDVKPGLHVRLSVPRPGPERATVIVMQSTVPIHSASVNRGGRYIAVALEDRAIVLWDTVAGRPTRTLAGHQAPVHSVAFSPDGQRLVSGGFDGAVILWDIEAGTPARTYKGHTGPVVSIAFSPDGERFLTGSPDGNAFLWETQTGERVHTLKSPRGINGVAYSPDGTLLGTASKDFTATLWDAKTGAQKFVLRGHREDSTCIAFSPDSKRVMTGSNDDTSIVWDATTGRRIGSGGRHPNDVRSVAFTPDGRRLISGEREELVMMWDAANGRNVWTFAGHVGEVQSIIPSPDGRTFLTASRDGTARLWDPATGRELLTLTTDGERKTWAVASPEGLFDASESGRHVLGYRFVKLPGGEIDQYFADGYHPGLLAEVWRGERPFPAKSLGRGKPPLVKLAMPKDAGSGSPTATLTADLVDQGGGVGAISIANNGIPVVVPTKAEPVPGGQVTRVTFTVPLVPGPNKIRVRSSDRDGSQESVASEVELAQPRIPGQRSRLYVVAVGIGDYPEKGLHLNYPAKDAAAIAELLRARGAKMFDRVDIVPVLNRDATRTMILDTVADVAELTRPQDTLVVLLCGHGASVGDRVYFAPHDFRTGTDRPGDALQKRGLAVDDIAAAMATAPALSRVLVVDSAASGEAFAGALNDHSEYGLRVAVEQWERSHGVYALAAVAATNRAVERTELGRGLLALSLLDAASSGAGDVTDWFEASAERATALMLKHTGARQDVQAGTRSKGFPLLATGK